MKGTGLGITLPLEKRCQVRLINDTVALEAAFSERMQVAAERFGGRVTEIQVTFPLVKTAFHDTGTKEVEICCTTAVAKIRPNAGNAFPYPLGSPEVRIYFPGLADGSLIPWLGGLYWLSGGSEPLHEGLPPVLRALVDVVSALGEHRVGIPCLWREGEWHLDRDLIFVARQVHRLLTDPGDYSPADCMNPCAAYYWAAHKDMLPLEPPVPELYGRSEKNLPPQERHFRIAEVN